MGKVKFSSPGSILGCNFFVVCLFVFFSVRTDFICMSVFEMALTYYENKIFIVTAASS